MSHILNALLSIGGEDEEIDISDTKTPPAAPPAAAAAESDPLDDEYEDLADFEQEDLVEDLASLNVKERGASDNVVKTRTYDMSITYDKYYQTPRVTQEA